MNLHRVAVLCAGLAAALCAPPARAKSPSLDAAREKLAGQGFKATDRVTGLVAGKASEHWWNESTGKCSLVVWFTKDSACEMTVESDAKQCTYPAPRKQ